MGWLNPLVALLVMRKATNGLSKMPGVCNTRAGARGEDGFYSGGGSGGLCCSSRETCEVRRTGSSAWGILLLLFAVGLTVRFVFAPRLDQIPFAPFLPMATIATLVCGWRKALALLAASAVAGRLQLASEPANFVMTPPFEVRVGAFLALGGFLIALTEALAEALQRLETAARVNADLFREMQHRVANNFQIVAATLQKARKGVADRAALDAIDHAIFRINSLAQLHRRLYDPTSYSGGLEPILREVLAETFHGVVVGSGSR